MRIIALISLLLLASGPAHAQQHYDGAIVDYQVPPAATEAALFDKSVIVVRGRVEDKREIPDAGGTSVYTLRILELLKNDGRFFVDNLMDVHRHGGLGVKNQERGFTPFEVGDEVVLFLEQSLNGWYWPLVGPDGAFKLTNGRTRPYGERGAVSKKHAGRSTAEFMAELRRHKK
jgi:hypothetical protein